MARGYLAFAKTHSGLFHLMFTAPGVTRDDASFCAASAASYRELHQVCAPFSKGGGVVETAVWSMVHGYALLGFDHIAQTERPLPAPPFAALLTILLHE